MTDNVSLKISPQFVLTENEEFKGRRLHKIQQALLNYDKISEFTVLTAPTGTGKSFAFPLPIIHYKRTAGYTSYSKFRCIIVSPTNALINDMEKEYATIFPDIRVCKLNRKKLDELNKKGPERWEAIFKLITDNDIVITNPDLLNFALFGGYERYNRGQKEINEIFARIDYCVFDEYHLYDEEQIANIISWITIKKALMPNKEVKFIFASATPEKGLLKILEILGFNPVEIIEHISDKSVSPSRKIHGQIDVTFIKNVTPLEYIISNIESIKRWINSGEKILVVFDQMKELRKARIDIENKFPSVAITEISGYFTKTVNKEEPYNAGLILGTNKIEVGVNLNVSICLMQTGKYFANFVQRFGRIAREGKDGKAIIFLENKIKGIEKVFSEQASRLYSYYDFIEKCRDIELLSDRKFYYEKIPKFLGAYYFIIAKNIRDYATQKMFKENIKLSGEMGYIFKVMKKIDGDIRRCDKNFGRGFKGDCDNWKKWWEIFTDTFKYFRAESPDVLVRDLDIPEVKEQIIRYSYEWILQNRIIIGEEYVNGERCFRVSGFSEEKQELQYYIESMPIYKLVEGTLYMQQKEKYTLKEAFENRLNEVAKLYRGQSEMDNTVKQLIKKITELKPIFTQKRLSIKDVKSYSNIL